MYFPSELPSFRVIANNSMGFLQKWQAHLIKHEVKLAGGYIAYNLSTDKVPRLATVVL